MSWAHKERCSTSLTGEKTWAVFIEVFSSELKFLKLNVNV